MSEWIPGAKGGVLSTFITRLIAFSIGLAAFVSAGNSFAQDIDPEMTDGDDEAEDKIREVPSYQLTAVDGWNLEVSGYLRTRYTRIQNDPDIEQFGRHDGFTLENARLEINGEYDDIGFRFEIDGAVDRVSGNPDMPVADVVARLKDAFGYYQPLPWGRLSIGQFEPPFDVAELRPTEELLFVSQPVVSRGVQGIEGYNVEGLSIARQVGIRLDSGEPFYFQSDYGPGVSYSLAVTNGQSANKNLNDNDKLAYYGRAAFHYGPWVKLGGAAFLNDRTIGVRPNRINRQETGWTADLTLEYADLTVSGNLVQTTYEPEIDVESARTAFGWHAQVGYEEPYIGLQPAYRLSNFDPSSSVGDEDTKSLVFENDALTYHTFGLNYDLEQYPVRLMVNYTVTGEQQQRQLKNDRFDALVQLEW